MDDVRKKTLSESLQDQIKIEPSLEKLDVYFLGYGVSVQDANTMNTIYFYFVEKEEKIYLKPLILKSGRYDFSLKVFHKIVEKM